MKKFTNEEVDNILATYGLKWYKGEYFGAAKVFYCINQDGYIVPIILCNLQRGAIPRPFHKKNPYTIQNIKTFLLNNKSHIKLISDKYHGTHSKNLSCICQRPNCNYTWTTSWGALQKLNTEDGGCQKCYGNIKFSMEDLNEKIKSREASLKIIGETNKNNQRYLKLKCTVEGCNHTWETSVAVFSSGCGCPKCAKRKLSGENHPMWNPSLTDEERITKRQYVEYQNFIKDVLSKNNYTCNITGKRGGKLEVHHLNGYHWYEEGRMDFDNVVVLLKEVHKEFHYIYGRGNNTKEQFEEFKCRLVETKGDNDEV